MTSAGERARGASGLFRTARQWLDSLGNIPLDRVLFDPPPGTAGLADVFRASEGPDRRCVELVNRTLVEKATGFRDSAIAALVSTLINNAVREKRLGVVTGEAGMISTACGNIRLPDVAFFRRTDLPDGKIPREKAPCVAPALAVEVLSEGNTAAEMRIKIAEYFQSGTALVWVLDPEAESVQVYQSPTNSVTLTRDQTLTAGDALPGFSVRVGELFDV